MDWKKKKLDPSKWTLIRVVNKSGNALDRSQIGQILDSLDSFIKCDKCKEKSCDKCKEECFLEQKDDPTANTEAKANTEDGTPPKQRTISCSFCRKVLEKKFYRCGACDEQRELQQLQPSSPPFRSSYYCNDECKKQDWKVSHRDFHKRLNRACKKSQKDAENSVGSEGAMSSSKPLGASPSSSSSASKGRKCAFRNCDRINDSNLKLRACSQCRDMAKELGRAQVPKSYYCREECLAADWKIGHKEYHEELQQKWKEQEAQFWRMFKKVFEELFTPEAN